MASVTHKSEAQFPSDNAIIVCVLAACSESQPNRSGRPFIWLIVARFIGPARSHLQRVAIRRPVMMTTPRNGLVLVPPVYVYSIPHCGIVRSSKVLRAIFHQCQRPNDAVCGVCVRLYEIMYRIMHADKRNMIS